MTLICDITILREVLDIEIHIKINKNDWYNCKIENFVKVYKRQEH